MWQAQVFTLYPEVFPGPLSKGLYGKASSNNLWNLKVVNIRDAAEDKHKTVDDTPYGGGSGMLLKADVLAKSLDQNKTEGERIIYLSPKGKKYDQHFAQELSKEKSVSFICGHFEGIDERVLSTRNIEEISIGDYVLSGGETAAFVVIVVTVVALVSFFVLYQIDYNYPCNNLTSYQLSEGFLLPHDLVTLYRVKLLEWCFYILLKSFQAKQLLLNQDN